MTSGSPAKSAACSRSRVLVTGHTCDGREVDWTALARTGFTLVVYMGVARAAAIAAGLLAGGLSPATPAAAIENGTLANQRVVTTTLGALPTAIATHRVRSPSVLVVGDVVAGARALAMRAA